MNNYPILSPDKEEDRVTLLRSITKERYQDIKDFDNLQNRFMAGRKSGKIPSGASDVDPSDRVGDMNYDDQYLYILIDNAGTAEWRRASLASW